MRPSVICLALCVWLVALASQPASVLADEPLFGPPNLFPTGNTPRDVVTGDFDENGDPDLVVANYQGQNITLLLGDGEGGVISQSDHFAGSGPWSLAVADLDADGHQDVLCANKASDDIAVFLGGGDGTLATVQRTYVGDRAHAVGVGDFDEDGNLDAVVGCSANLVADRAMWVMLGDGAGGLTRAGSFAPGITPEGIVVEDFDGDGHADVAIVNHDTDDVTVLRGLGNGTFQALPSPSVADAPNDMVSGDFDGDGEHDLVTANFGSYSQTMLFGTGTGQFAGRQDHAAGRSPFGVAVGDFDDDQHLDVIVANAVDDDISVFLGDGAGGMADDLRFTTGSGSEPHGVAVADFDVDGVDDVATANWGSHDVAILLSSGTPSPVLVSRMNASPTSDAVTLTWETSFERDHAGFYLERGERDGLDAGDAGDGRGGDGEPWSRLGAGLITPPGPYRYEDATVLPATTYIYRLVAVDRAGAAEVAAMVEVRTPSGVPEGVDTGGGAGMRLLAESVGVPVRLTFELAEEADIRLDVYDVRGRTVRRLLGAPLAAGRHVVIWDGASDAGRSVPRGVYFGRLEAARSRAVARILILE